MQPVMGSLATLEWSIHKIGGDELHLDSDKCWYYFMY